ncbi:hypothetical protein HNP48_004689 [Acidovorax soli]|uniref:DUF4145 domain-containing protein n=1 Tax=Acidovorax soli TaxID=592050 RepID=A0A7X0PHC5_9BURK|nr:hypothetical protein [Acidovorax soli]MBB6561987.1 hypothetical protein [Acidovorax soli]
MGWLEFISKIVAAIAWPAAVVILGVLFKGKLEQLLGKVRRAKGAGFEFDFISVEEKAEAAKQSLKEELSEPPPPREQPSTHVPASESENTAAPVPERPKFSMVENDGSEELEHLRPRDLNPSALILSAWSDIEVQLLEFINERAIFVSTSHTRSPAGWLQAIQQEGALPKNLINSIRELQQLRNRVAHADSWMPDRDDANRYFNAARSVIFSIREVQKRGGNVVFRDNEVDHFRPKDKGEGS